jgi:putative transposase
VNANQADAKVRTMCRVLGVSASGYYAWRDRAPSARKLADAVLVERIRRVHADSLQTYGMPRVRAELIDQGVAISRKRVARLMRVHGIRGISRRRGFVVTTRREQGQGKAPDLVQRRFEAAGPNRLWVADLTYVPTWAGFIYLAVVIDAWSRRVVGWAIGETMTAELVLQALNMALQQRRPDGVIHHSDQGSQYASIAFGERCKRMGVRPSMGSVGDAYDNAMAESFFASLECELIDRRSWQTKTEARLALFTYIEGWYNPRRRHSALEYLSPMNFESKHADPLSTRGQHGLPTVGVCVAAATPPVDNPAIADIGGVGNLSP